MQTRLQTEGACPNADSNDDTEEEISSTPDQSAEKPGMEKLATFGSSILNGIILDAEDKTENAATAPLNTARSIVVH
jgi:hypothetical protein